MMPAKPRIRMMFGEWRCSASIYHGVGLTPLLAYHGMLWAMRDAGRNSMANHYSALLALREPK